MNDLQMNRSCRCRIVALILCIVLQVPMLAVQAADDAGLVTRLLAAFDAEQNLLVVDGETRDVWRNTVVVEVTGSDESRIFYGTTTLDAVGAFHLEIRIGSAEGTIAIRAADYAGGLWLGTTLLRNDGTVAGTGLDTTPFFTLPTVDNSLRTHFTDLTEEERWAASAINGLAELGVLNGLGDGTFRPRNPVRRGDAVSILMKAFQLNGAAATAYADVPADRWDASAISTARGFDLLWDSGERFFPDEPMTRQEAVVLLVRVLSLKGVSLPVVDSSALIMFRDRAAVSADAVQAISSLVNAGILKGGSGLLSPSSAITRAEIAALSYRALQFASR